MTTKTQRLFFALWPEPKLQQAIYQQTKSSLSVCHGRLLPVEHFHITLSFLGSVDEKKRICVEDMAGQIQASAFSMALELLGFWKKPQVAWVAPEETPLQLNNLVEQLNLVLEKCGFETETRPFLPHMTLVRKAKRAPEVRNVEPLHWKVDKFVLVESQTLPQGAQYQILKQWLLK